DLADALSEDSIAGRNRTWAARGLDALEGLWSEEHGYYRFGDRVAGTQFDSPSIGGLIPIFAPIPKPRAAAIAKTIEAIASHVRYLIPSHDPRDARFEVRRYWRGPVWLVCNYMIA